MKSAFTTSWIKNVTREAFSNFAYHVMVYMFRTFVMESCLSVTSNRIEFLLLESSCGLLFPNLVPNALSLI